MEDTLKWLEKRMDKLKAEKKKESTKDAPDLFAMRIIGTRIATIRQVVQYIKTHEHEICNGKTV